MKFLHIFLIISIGLLTVKSEDEVTEVSDISASSINDSEKVMKTDDDRIAEVNSI